MEEFNRSLPMRLLRAREVYLKLFRPVFTLHEITEQQWRVLRALRDEGEQSGQDLSRKCILSGPSLSRIISLLNKKNYISRRIQPDDQRYMLVKLSDEGRALCDRIAPLIEEKYRELENVISPSETDQLHALLDKVIAADE
ncbi:homoprotocatechuate degradation operon regulator HpaR [Emcibacter sp.]|uniref:homoprotocatechuate degradation operon regulator HpaR n=1 Tax=Emcibacter sp. TaxID=1979954 RepID=UPI002AA91AD4|nr:homoprotocatechuate degradation operon regulator HpaR [Emcibacter sp.]